MTCWQRAAVPALSCHLGPCPPAFWTALEQQTCRGHHCGHTQMVKGASAVLPWSRGPSSVLPCPIIVVTVCWSRGPLQCCLGPAGGRQGAPDSQAAAGPAGGAHRLQLRDAHPGPQARGTRALAAGSAGAAAPLVGAMRCSGVSMLPVAHAHDLIPHPGSCHLPAAMSTARRPDMPSIRGAGCTVHSLAVPTRGFLGSFTWSTAISCLGLPHRWKPSPMNAWLTVHSMALPASSC